MSNTPESVRKVDAPQYTDSSGFKDSYEQENKESVSQKSKNMQNDPGIPRKRDRFHGILKLGKKLSSHKGDDESLTSAQKRRQQVYQAQKRHRNRHAEYVAKLEAEVARLQHLDAVVNSEKNALARQNKAIKEFLAKQSIDAQLQALNVNTSPQSEAELSQSRDAAIDFRMDEEMGHERIFLEMQAGQDTPGVSSETAANVPGSKQFARHAPVAGDSWAALDFILALEWPCRTHVHHDVLNPNTEISPACDLGHFHGHALTATQAVLQSALPFPQPENASSLSGGNIEQSLESGTSNGWILPHSEIDKLVELAGMLEIHEQFITPAQAYSAVRETVPNDVYLRPVLEALKIPLGPLVQCYGFGAGMDSALFWQHLDATTKSLGLNSSLEGEQ